MKNGDIIKSLNTFVSSDISHDIEILKGKKNHIIEIMFRKYFNILKCKSLSDMLNKIDQNNKRQKWL